MKILHESIDGNKLTFPAAKGAFEPNTVYLITDVKILKPIQDELWEIVQEAYKKIGGYKGHATKLNWLDKTDAAKIVLDIDGQVAAVSMYTTKLGGNKCFCAARSYKTHTGGTAIRQIVEDDVIDYDGYYWAEVSHGFEKLFKEKGGNPIPNIYAAEFLRQKPSSLTLSNDDVHYSRIIGDNECPLTKMIFGFKTRELAKKICAEIADYQAFKVQANSQEIVEAFNSTSAEEVKKTELACDYVNQISELVDEWDCQELLPSWITALNESVMILTQALRAKQSAYSESKLRQFKSCLKLAKLYLQTYPKLVVHQFHAKKR